MRLPATGTVPRVGSESAMGEELRVAIVEDQARTRQGLAALLRSTPDLRVVGPFGDMESALAGLDGDPADVVLLDIGLPGMSGIEGVRRLRRLRPSQAILMLTVYGDDDHVFEAICAGACGYLLKDTPPDRLVEAIRELGDGGAPMSPEVARKVVQTFQRVAPAKSAGEALSPRESEVLRLLAEGHSYKTLASHLGLALDTVRFHVRNVYDKLHVHSKSEAVLKAVRSGLV
jgi:DNA-binding NarL/FixJ family response regulator